MNGHDFITERTADVSAVRPELHLPPPKQGLSHAGRLATETPRMETDRQFASSSNSPDLSLARPGADYRTLHCLRRSFAALLLSLPLLFGLATEVAATDQDQIQMSKATRTVSESGNHKRVPESDNTGGIRVVVDIGDGLTPKGHDRTINYTVGGTATRGNDDNLGNDAADPKDYYIDGCESSSCSVKLPANRHSAVITIYVNHDSLDEGAETIVITLEDGTGYTVNDAKKTTTVTINDDDTRGLTFYRKWPDVDEGRSETHTLKLSSQPTAAVTVKIVSNNQDVTVSPASLTFNPSGSNLWSGAQTVTVSAAQDDDAVDDTATLTYTTSGGDYGGANSLSIERPVSVDDDDTSTTTGPQLPRISLTGGADVTEGTAASFTVNADPAPTSSLTVSVEVIEPPGQDFVVASEERVRTVTLNAGATSTTFTVPTVDDSTAEDDGDVQVSVNDGTGYVAGQGAAVTILDDDGTRPPTTPAAYFASASSSAAESAGTRNVTVTIFPSPSSGFSLGYSVTGTATVGSGNDFTIQSSGTVAVAAGATSASIPIAINDDSTEENDETVILTLTGGTGYTLGSTTVHTLTITDNDSTGQAILSLSGPADANEGNSGTSDKYFTVSLSKAPSRFVSWQLCFTGTATIDVSASGTIPANADYQPISGQTPIDLTGRNPVCTSWSFSPPFNSLTNTDLGVRIKGDTDSESDETVSATLSIDDGPADVVLGTDVATYTIRNDDSMLSTTPTASFASESSSATENAGTRNVTVNLSSAAPSGGLVLSYYVSGTATAGNGNDFTIQGSGTLSVTAGANTATIPVAINDDSATESTETVILTLTDGTGYTLGSSTVHTLTITDNDETSSASPTANTPVVSIERLGTSPITEGGAVTFELRAAPAPSSAITVNVNIADTGDFVASVQSGVRQIEMSGSSETFTVATVDDDVVESSGTITARVASGNGYSLSSNRTASVTVDDNDGHEISFGSTEGRVREGEMHRVAVRIFPVADRGIELSYSISGTATKGDDYKLPASSEGPVTVPAGSSQVFIQIDTIADEEDDSGETVVLNFDLQDAPVDLSLGTPNKHVLTLVDSKESILEAGRSWLVRFGRSVAEQVVDSISQRLRATRIEGTQVSVAGAQVPIGHSRAFGTFEPPTNNRPIDFDTHSQTSAQGSTQTLSERELIQSSSFMSVSESDAQGGSFAVWGRAAHSSFEGRDKELSLDGDSTSVMLGADYAQQYWQAGATLIQSEGKGSYRDEVISGDAEASITSIVPWAAVQATERVQLWGALGTGDGDLELTEEDSDTLKTNIDWSMAAAGLRSVLVPASGQNGLQLSLVGDALWVETKADPIEGLSIADAQASRLRLGLEGELATELSSGAEMISRLEFGVREDRGDAETGGGIEIGGGIAWRDARQGLRIELAGRKLLSYDNDELEDEGISLSFDYDPAPNTEEGLSLSLHQEVGVRSNGGLEALFDSEPLAMRTNGEKENRVRLEAAYGVPVLSGRFIAGPKAAMSHSTTARDYSIGWNLVSARRYEDISLQITALRSESHDRTPEHGISLGINARW